MSISKTSYYYKPKLRQEDARIKHYLLSLSIKHKRWGFDKMRDKSRLDNKGWNHNGSCGRTDKKWYLKKDKNN